MKKSIIWCAFLLSFAGCTAELVEENKFSDMETLKVSFDPETRIQLDENQKTIWNEGDLLSVYNYNESNERWRFMGETGDISGIIQRYKVVEGGAPMDERVVVYPYNPEYIIDPASKTISTYLYHDQRYLKGSYGIDENIMVASGTGDNFILKNVFGWLKIQLIGSANVKEILLFGNDHELIAGSMDINYETLDVTIGEETYEGEGTSRLLYCEENGATLDSDPTSFYIALPPVTFKNGFTVVIYGSDGSVLEKSTSKEVVIERNVIKPFSVLQFGEIIEGSCKDLSSEGTANSYIVSEAGSYKFPTVQGNSSTSVGAVASAEVLWETFGTDTAPNVGDLVSEVSYSDGFISFKASDRKGNALIAAKDASGNILWSWHIWMTDKPKDQVYKNNAGTMMDRNLGATSATPGDVGALGLMYQWGRKDPFLGSSSISEPIQAESTLPSWSTETSTESTGTIAYVTSNPTTFIMGNNNNYDWWYSSELQVSDHTLWTSTKTMYDPCPVGYRVPDGGEEGVWMKAFGIEIDYYFNHDGYDSTNYGFNFGKSKTNSYLTDETVCWYPIAGTLNYVNGSFYDMGNRGCYWSCTPMGTTAAAYIMSFYNLGLVSTITEGHFHGQGNPIRCLRE